MDHNSCSCCLQGRAGMEIEIFLMAIMEMMMEAIEELGWCVDNEE